MQRKGGHVYTQTSLTDKCLPNDFHSTIKVCIAATFLPTTSRATFTMNITILALFLVVVVSTSQARSVLSELMALAQDEKTQDDGEMRVLLDMLAQVQGPHEDAMKEVDELGQQLGAKRGLERREGESLNVFLDRVLKSFSTHPEVEHGEGGLRDKILKAWADKGETAGGEDDIRKKMLRLWADRGETAGGEEGLRHRLLSLWADEGVTAGGEDMLRHAILKVWADKDETAEGGEEGEERDEFRNNILKLWASQHETPGDKPPLYKVFKFYVKV